MNRQYYVYILTNNSNNVLYTGITNNLKRRIHEHKEKLMDGFTKKYNVTNLVYYEIFDDAEIIEPGGEVRPVKEYAVAEGVEFAPTLLFIDPNGKRMGRYTGYQTPERFEHILAYLGDGAWQHQSLKSYLAERAAVSETAAGAELIDDPLFEQPPYALDRRRFAASQPLVVLFVRKGCAECEDFHRKVLAEPEVRAFLEGFEVVQLDIGDTETPVLAPDGQKLTPAQWWDKTGLDRLPALLFFNETGEEVLNTDALVRKGRMMNSLNFTLERAYEKGWTYQRFARTKSIERAQKAAAAAAAQ